MQIKHVLTAKQILQLTRIRSRSIGWNSSRRSGGCKSSSGGRWGRREGGLYRGREKILSQLQEYGKSWDLAAWQATTAMAVRFPKKCAWLVRITQQNNTEDLISRWMCIYKASTPNHFQKNYAYTMKYDHYALITYTVRMSEARSITSIAWWNI